MRPIAITVAEFCRICGVGKTTAYALLKSGALERRKIGSRTLITMDSVDRLISVGRNGEAC